MLAKPFHRVVGCLVLGLAAVALHAADEKPAKSDKELLQGTWNVVAMHEGENPVGDEDLKEMAMRLRFEGDNVVSIRGEGDPKPAGFTIDSARSPKELRISPTKGREAGHSYVGIYELAGDNLTISFASDVDKPAPTDFKPAQKKIVLKLTRAK